MPGMGVGGIWVKIGADAREFMTALSSAERKINQFGASLAVAGQRMSLAFTAPLTALGGFALKTGADFEKAVAGVRKTVDETKVSMDELEKSFRDMAKTSQFSAVEFADFARIGAQMGIGQGNDMAKNTRDLKEFAKAIAEVSIAASELPAEQAAKGLSRLMSITGEDVGEGIGKLGSTLAFLGDKLPTTEERILNFGVRIAGVAGIANMTAEEILGISAGLSSVVEGTERASTQVVALVEKLVGAIMDGGPALEEFSAIIGKSGEEIQAIFKDKGLGPVMVDFIAGLERLQQEGTNTFQVLRDVELGNSRAITTFLAAAGASDVMAQAWDAATVNGERFNKTNKEVAIQNETVAAKLAMLWHQIQDVGIEAFNAFEGVIRDVISVLSEFVKIIAYVVKGISYLPESFKLGMAAALGMLAALGPLLFAIGSLITIGPSVNAALGVMAKALAAMGITATATGTAVTGAATATKTAAASMSLSFSGLLIILGKIALAIAVFKLSYTEFSKVLKDSSVFQGLIDQVGKLADKFYAARAAATDTKEAQRLLQLATDIMINKTGDATVVVTDLAEAYKIVSEQSKEMRDRQTEVAQSMGLVDEKGKATIKNLQQQVNEAIKSAKEHDKLSKVASALGLSYEDLVAKGADFIAVAIATTDALVAEEKAAEKLAEKMEDVFNKTIEASKAQQELNKRAQEFAIAERARANEAMIGQGAELRGVKKKQDQDYITNPKNFALLPGMMTDVEAYIYELRKKAVEEAKDITDELQANFRDLGKVIGGLNEIFDAFGISTDNLFRILTTGFVGFVGGISGFIDGLKTIKDAGTALGGGFTKGLTGGKGGLSGIFAGIANIASIAGPIASAAVAVIGIMKKIFSKPEHVKVMEEVGRDYGTAISEGLAKEIVKTAEKLDLGRFEATLLHLADIIEEAGGITESNLGEFTKGINDLMNAIALGAVPAAEGMKALDEAFTQMVEGLQEMGPKGAIEIAKLIERAKELGIVSEEMKKFVRDMAESALDKLDAFFELLNTQFGEGGIFEGDMEAAAQNVGVLIAAFGAAVTAAGGLGGAIAMLPEAFDALMQKFGELLGTESKAFNELKAYYEFAKENQEALAGIEGLISGMQDLLAIGVLNKDNINDFGAAAVAQFNAILASTGNEEMALAAILPQLAELLKMYEQLGVEVPPELQEIADKALAAGMSLEPPEGMEDILGSIRDILYDIAAALGAVTDEARGANSALSDLGTGTNVNVGASGDGRVHAAEGFSGVVTGPTPFLAGEAGPEFVDITPLTKGGSSGGGMGSGPVSNNITVNLPPGSDEDHANRIARLVERGIAGLDKRIAKKVGL